MGHHREVSRARLSLPVRQVLADCGHVCLLLHDSCHDSRPSPGHLLPVAGLPWGNNVPLEHPCHGGLGLGASPQHTAGREGWTHKNTWWNRKWELSGHSHPDFYSRTHDVGLFLAGWGHCSLPNGRNWQSCLRECWPPSLCSVCQVFIFSRSEMAPGEFECWGQFIEPWGLKAYVTWMTVAVFLLPALIITICQVILVALAWLSISVPPIKIIQQDYMLTATLSNKRSVWHEWNSVLFSCRVHLACIVW